MWTLYFCPVVSSSFFPRLISGVAYIYHTSSRGLGTNLGCRSETCCLRLAGNAGPKKSPKICHLGTIAQLCRALSSQLRRYRQSKKKLVKQQYLPHISSQYRELRLTSGWDLLASLGHPRKFQWVSCLGSVTARHSSSGRQPNFSVLNRGRQLYSTGWPSRWALAHILVVQCFVMSYSLLRRSGMARVNEGSQFYLPSTCYPQVEWMVIGQLTDLPSRILDKLQIGQLAD